MALKVRMRSRTSGSDLPFTAPDMSDAEDWLMEQPWPDIRMSLSVSVVHVHVDDDFVAAQRD